MSDPNDNSQEFRQDKISDPYEKKQNDNMVLISLLLGIFGISVIGFILIIIARRKGATGTLSTVSFVINLLGVCAVVIILAAVIFFAVLQYLMMAAEVA